MRIATWNVNSIRSRIDRVEAFVQRHDIDVLALQETKARDDQWPTDGARGDGLRGGHARPQPVERRRDRLSGSGSTTYSTASRGCRSTATRWPPRRGRSARRAAACGCGRSTCPNGRALGDPHLDYKLAWLEALRDAAAGWLAEDPDAAGGAHRRLEHRAARRGRLRHGAVREEHPRDAAGAGGVPGGRGRRVRRRRATAHARARRSTPTGTTTGSASSGTAGMRIDFVLGSPALAGRVDRCGDRPGGARRQGRPRPRPGHRRPRRASTRRWSAGTVGALRHRSVPWTWYDALAARHRAGRGSLLGALVGAAARARPRVARPAAAVLRARPRGRGPPTQAVVRDSLDRLHDQMRDIEQHRVSWQSQLKQQVDEVRHSTESLRRETSSLSTALRKPQVRGRWGELHLRRAVELAGMVERCDFDEQVSVAQRRRPAPPRPRGQPRRRQARGRRRQGAARRLPRRDRAPTTTRSVTPT